MVAVHTTEAGIEEYGCLVEAQLTNLGIEIVKGDAALGVGAANVGRQEISLVVVLDIGHTVTGIVNDEFLVLALRDIRYPVFQLLFENHLLGGILCNVYVLYRNTEGLLAIVGKHAGIVDSVWHIAHEAIVLVANNQSIGVIAGVEAHRDGLVDV